jgi:hypothetical protein
MATDTVKSLFEPSDTAFHIPSYQRAYAWRADKQLAQFLADLEEQPSGKDYFLGHFLLERTHATKPHYHVIDGQQRLTTIVLFFSSLVRELRIREQSEALRDADGDEVAPWRLSERYLLLNSRPKLRTVPDDQSYFEQAVLRQAAGAQPDLRRQAQRRLAEALATFTKRFQQTDTATLLRWMQTVEGARITKFEVADKVQATQIFAFQNDRGIDLTELEKLKAYLMYQAYLAESSSEVDYTIRHVESGFGEIYKLSEEIDLGENTVFSYHVTAFGKGNGGFEGMKRELRAVAEAERAAWIRHYTDQLMRSFLTVRTLEDAGRGYSNITGLVHLDAGNSWPLLLKLQHYHRDDEALREQLYRLMEIALFKKAYSTGSYRTNDFPWLARHYQGDVAQLTEALRQRAEQGFQWYWAFTGDFHRRLEASHHYERNTRYLLWHYENHLRRQLKRPESSGADLFNSWNLSGWQQTLDHIAPQSGDYSPDFQEKLLHNLGNLALMTQGPNSRKRDTVAEEAEAYKFSTSLADQHIGETLRQEKTWGADQIKARAERIAEFARQHWTVPA